MASGQKHHTYLHGSSTSPRHPGQRRRERRGRRRVGRPAHSDAPRHPGRDRSVFAGDRPRLAAEGLGGATMTAPIDALLIDAETGDAGRVALEVIHADDEQTYLEISTAERVLLLVIENDDAADLAHTLYPDR
jgi:hypothetical protein